ncbi:hypothetical protein [Trinickia dinghuensis]|uniref:Uncharacterized protein n=1 Tax=Trinickia dinghuensis TaxID=2291023 RepID=A0A3D8K465_9BURK|nr:hypothetical protein [Trinickia dinghuensis]RDU99812.1 hypothetical protein DWV00_05200 [Trinickia dinghuensis]
MSGETLSSLSEFTGHFENGDFAAKNFEDPFYYEKSTKTINFGYGINLTGAAAAAAAKHPYAREIIDAELKAQGITITEHQWELIRKISANPNPREVVDDLNRSLPAKHGSSWKSEAAAVMDAFYAKIVEPELVKKVPNLDSLPVGAQWALKDLYYNSPKLWGPKIEKAAKDGDLVGIANELALDTTRHSAGTGAELRSLGRATLALGGIPTYGPDNTLTKVDWSRSNQSDLSLFHFLALSTTAQVGMNRSSAAEYISKWDHRVSASHREILASLETHASTDAANNNTITPPTPLDTHPVDAANQNTISPAMPLDTHPVDTANQNIIAPAAPFDLYAVDAANPSTITPAAPDTAELLVANERRPRFC